MGAPPIYSKEESVLYGLIFGAYFTISLMRHLAIYDEYVLFQNITYWNRKEDYTTGNLTDLIVPTTSVP